MTITIILKIIDGFYQISLCLTKKHSVLARRKKVHCRSEEYKDTRKDNQNSQYRRRTNNNWPKYNNET